jgi:aminopeptidase-like protein
MTYGDEMYSWIRDLFPINRSLSGDGNRETLNYLKQIAPEIQINSFISGSTAFDWTLPDEWNVLDAYIEKPDGSKFAEFSKNNLHLVGYSIPINKTVLKSELLRHLHYLDELPDAIPYVTSYYSKTWGFCVTKQDIENLGEGPFRVYINSTFKGAHEGGVLNYGEAFLPGNSSQEVLFSTYICHPSMANNELSGPVISTALIRFLSKSPHHYSFRFLFLPETIGSIAYLSKNLPTMKKNIIAGWVLSCLGDSANFSYVPSRSGINYADRITKEILSANKIPHKIYGWLDRGSDERQYCAPGVDLPVCSLVRSKYGTYPEYHTSLDNLDLVKENSLEESFEFFLKIIEKVESQRVPKSKILCEPQLGKRNLYSNISTRTSYDQSTRQLVDILSLADGCNTLNDLADRTGISILTIDEILQRLLKDNLIDL